MFSISPGDSPCRMLSFSLMLLLITYLMGETTEGMTVPCPNCGFYGSLCSLKVFATPITRKSCSFSILGVVFRVLGFLLHFQVVEAVVVLVLILVVQKKFGGVYYLSRALPLHQVVFVSIAAAIPLPWIILGDFQHYIVTVSHSSPGTMMFLLCTQRDALQTR